LHGFDGFEMVQVLFLELYTILWEHCKRIKVNDGKMQRTGFYRQISNCCLGTGQDTFANRL
jgi:hypothetical protein